MASESQRVQAPVVNAVPTPPWLPPKKQRYPFYLGGLAATIAASTTHPLDLVKLRLQASGEKGMVACMKKTVRTAGFMGFFDGITGAWLRQMSYSTCRFWVYEASKKLLSAGSQPSPWVLPASGVVAGLVAGVVGNPADIVLVRLQGDFAKPPEKRFNYKHCFDALFRMVREEGPSSLMRGIGPNLSRSVLANLSQLASYDLFKSELLKTSYFEDNIACHFTASFAAGAVATTVCSPADVLKSRVMNASGPKSPSALSVIRTSLANEGPMFMFKGWLPAFIRISPTTILTFLTLEQLKCLVDWRRGAL